jgi:hypothetical protein
MKYLLIILTFSSLAYSQNQEFSFENKLQKLEDERLRIRSGEDVISQPSVTEVTGLEKDRGPIGITSEWSYYYLLIGKPIINYDDEKLFGSSLAFGHKRLANSFLYGVEYNFSKLNDILSLQDIGIQLGFQTIWKHRFQPFITFNFGTSSLEEHTLNKTFNGYKTGLDVGINLNPYSMFKLFTGMRYNTYNFEKLESGEVSTQEFYITLGIDI